MRGVRKLQRNVSRACMYTTECWYTRMVCCIRECHVNSGTYNHSVWGSFVLLACSISIFIDRWWIVCWLLEWISSHSIHPYWLCVLCVCVCVCVCVWVCVSMCVSVWVCECVYECVSVCVCVCYCYWCILYILYTICIVCMCMCERLYCVHASDWRS